MHNLSDAEKGYLAGLIDGEGSISIVRATTGYNRKSRRIHHQLRVSVYNTDINMVEWVKSRVGFGHIARRKQQSERHKPSYQYQVCALKALEILRAVHPYLVTKKRQAEVAFIFGSTIKERLNNGCGRRGIAQNIVDLRESCKVSINALNGNNGGHKLRLWKNNGCELGELPAERRDNPEPSRN